MDNFHDGLFDGIRMEPDKAATIFLRSVEKRPYILVLKGIEALSLSGFKEGNIIFDLVIRSATQATVADIQELYKVGDHPEMASQLLDKLKGRDLQILVLSPSYGAEGLFLFESLEFKEIDPVSS